MKKRHVLLGAIVALLGLIIAAIIFLLGSKPIAQVPVPPPVSTAVSSPVPNPVIDIETQRLKAYQYAVITASDTIELRNSQGQKLVINLDKKKWKDIKWSSDKSFVSVLGESSAGIYDLYIYSLASKNWRQSTSYTSSGVGIDSYIWRGDDSVFFTQGKKPDYWFHRYNFSSNEIQKLERVDGAIYAISPDETVIAIKIQDPGLDPEFAFIALDGSLLYKLNASDSNNSLIQVERLVFTTNSDKLVLQSKQKQFYGHDFGTSRGTLVTNGQNLTLLCGVNEVVVLGVEQREVNKTLTYSTLNIQTDLPKLVATETFDEGKEFDFDKSVCFDTNNVILKQKEGNIWYTQENSEIIELVVLQETVDADYK